MTRPATAHDDGAPTRRKATLFCWECDHSSPVDGDWRLESRDRYVAYVCPDCETTLTKRPRSDEPSRTEESIGPLTAWQRTVRASATVWRASIDVGFSGLTALFGVRTPPALRNRRETS